MNTNTGEVYNRVEFERLAEDAVKVGRWRDIVTDQLTPLQQKQLARTGRTTVSRNSPCPCGSGKRFKRCCKTEAGAEAEAE